MRRLNQLLPRADLGPLAPPAPGPRLSWLALSLFAALVAFYYTGNNAFRVPGVVPWVLAVGLWLVAWWPGGVGERESGRAGERGIGPTGVGARPEGHPSRAEARGMGKPSPALPLLALVAIIALGVFFRFHRLEQTPSDPTSDHAEKLLDVQDLLDGQRPIYFPRNTGREPAQFYLTAFGLVRGLGLPPDFDTLKIGTALVDVLAIPAVYLLAAELGGRPVGLAAAALYAIGKWPVAIARAGLRFPYGPLPTALTLWLLLRYLRRGDRRDVLLCGLVIGAGLYGYSPFRVVVLAAGLFLLLALIFDGRRRGRRLELIGDGLLLAGTAALVFLPLGHYMLEKPEMFWFRAATRAGAVERDLYGSGAEALLAQLGVFALNNWNAALAFNVRGDSTHVNAVQYDPWLDPLTGAAFLLGVGLVVYRIVRNRDLRYAALVLAIPILMLSSTLSIAFPIENPSVNRAGPAAPVIFAIAALPVALLARGLARPRRGAESPLPEGEGAGVRTPAAIALIAIGLGAFLFVAAQHNYGRYFVEFDAQYRDFVPNTSEVAAAIRAAAAQGVDRERAYHVPFPYWLDTRNIAIELGDIRWAERHAVAGNEALPTPRGGGPVLFVIHKDDRRRLDEVARRWPNGTLTLVRSAVPGKEFYTFLVPG